LTKATSCGKVSRISVDGRWKSEFGKNKKKHAQITKSRRLQNGQSKKVTNVEIPAASVVDWPGNTVVEYWRMIT